MIRAIRPGSRAVADGVVPGRIAPKNPSQLIDLMRTSLLVGDRLAPI
jgi:hypothetical protein